MSDSYTPKNYTREEIEAIRIIRRFVEPHMMALETAKAALDAMRAAGLAVVQKPWSPETSLLGCVREAVRAWLAWKPEETPDTVGCPEEVVRAMDALAARVVRP